ncbi:MAG: ribonuclease III [Oscillospiraceae bacterium]|nr:ribonuclease III [Oscillospiraceae bacterium]
MNTNLETKLDYKFKNAKLLSKALTHSSYANEIKHKSPEIECNERMEFLGDSILSMVVTDYLYRNHPNMPEGDLSRIRAAIVCEKTLVTFAKRLELGKYLYLSNGENASDGRERPSILADAFEAVLAAMYLDGGLDNVKKFLVPQITDEIGNIFEKGNARDYKTILQQIVQQEQGEILEYVIVAESGPAHRKFFEVEAKLNSNVIGRGQGYSKREAEQFAAKEALILFGEK